MNLGYISNGTLWADPISSRRLKVATLLFDRGIFNNPTRDSSHAARDILYASIPGGPCAVRLSVNGPLGSAQTVIEPCNSSLPPNARNSSTTAARNARPSIRSPCDRLRTRRQDLHPRRQRHMAPHGARPERLSRLRSLRPRPRRTRTRLREPARARRRPRPGRATPRARSLLRADANDLCLRRAGPRVSAHRHLTRLPSGRRPSGRRLSRLTSPHSSSSKNRDSAARALSAVTASGDRAIAGFDRFPQSSIPATMAQSSDRAIRC